MCTAGCVLVASRTKAAFRFYCEMGQSVKVETHMMGCKNVQSQERATCANLEAVSQKAVLDQLFTSFLTSDEFVSESIPLTF